ncbi:MAG: hypothetical protein ACLQA5_12020 [Solirubrobacteraceae bacterium]
MRRSGRRTAALLLGSAVAAGLAAGVAVVLFAAPALASTGQVSVIEDDTHLEANPAATLERMRLLGADVVRVSVPWQMIAPAPSSARVPFGFDAADPAAYPAANWGLWDEIVTDAARDGITVDLDLMGGAPRWAQGPGRPAGNLNANWEPSAAAFGQFVQAIATRYSGSYDPALGRTVPGDAGDLPRVGFWSIWNEPNYGPSLAPQGVPGNLGVENSPRMYRQMLDAAWAALSATGHGPATDTILIGELAPRGANQWGVFSGMKPLVFLRALYCVSSAYRSLRGEAARVRGCPTTAAGSRRFHAQHPALFEATGVADHPYMRWYPPTVELNPDPTNGSTTADYASLAVIGHLTGALDRLQRVYGSSRRLPIFDTEFGYITSPPKHSPDPGSHGTVRYLAPAVAADYMNWSEYVSWRNPRIRSFAQYPIYDPVRPLQSNDWGGYASGLLTWNGVPKATYAAWRLPVFLPITSTRRGRSLEVWGCVRPAPFAALDTGAPQTVAIQFARDSSGASGPFTTIQTVKLGGTSSCYFDVRVKFPASGTVRLGYTYPPSDPLLPAQQGQVVSRSVQVTLRK